MAVPSDQQAVGWRVAVYWPDDSTLHDGEIVGYDNVSLRHHVRYDCGDQEHVSLNTTKVSGACQLHCSLELGWGWESVQWRGRDCNNTQEGHNRLAWAAVLPKSPAGSLQVASFRLPDVLVRLIRLHHSR